MRDRIFKVVVAFRAAGWMGLGIALADSRPEAASAVLPILAGPYPNPHNGHVYYLLQPASWTESEARAQALGGHLVTVNDDRECDWIFDTFSFFGGQPRALWCGLHDAGNEGTFVWSSGEAVTFENWASGEPNASADLGPVENHVFLYPAANPRERRWRDATDPGSETFLSTALWTPAEDVQYDCHGVVEIRPREPHTVRPRLSRSGQGISLRWEVRPGSGYLVQSASQPAGPWSNEETAAVAEGDEMLWTLPSLAEGTLFLRVLVVR